jgi:hypothetical protein
MTAIVWMMLGFSSVSGLMLISDWVRAHRPSVYFGRRPELQVRVNAPAWALEEVQSVQAAERLSQLGAAATPRPCLGGGSWLQRWAEAV